MNSGVLILLALAGDSKRAIVLQLARGAELDVEQLATELGITISGARQHLAQLETHGAITYRRAINGAGRPRHVYRLVAPVLEVLGG